jgi:hypothetical protein
MVYDVGFQTLMFHPAISFDFVFSNLVPSDVVLDSGVSPSGWSPPVTFGEIFFFFFYIILVTCVHTLLKII